jgi:hypothetical protein
MNVCLICKAKVHEDHYDFDADMCIPCATKHGLFEPKYIKRKLAKDDY